MKRSAMPPRRGYLQRRTPLNPVSQVRAAATPERERVRDLVLARDGRCLLDHHVAFAGYCFGPLTFHHLHKEGQGGPYTEANGVALCSRHNGWVENFPIPAQLLGLVVSRKAGIDHDEAARLRQLNGLVPTSRNRRI